MLIDEDLPALKEPSRRGSAVDDPLADAVYLRRCPWAVSAAAQHIEDFSSRLPERIW
jgi:hypothetical protein